jgi:hypothetical protein
MFAGEICVVASGVSLVAVSATLPNGARLGERTGAECTRPKENLIRLLFPPGGSGERAAVTLTRVPGYGRSHRGRQRRPIIRSITHAPDQTLTRSQLFHCIDLAARAVAILPFSDFHELSRAVSPKGHLRKTQGWGYERPATTPEPASLSTLYLPFRLSTFDRFPMSPNFASPLLCG